MKSRRAFLALGSNVGDRQAHLDDAIHRLDAHPQVTVISATPSEETAPVGVTDQPDFLNQMVLVETNLDPHALLTVCHRVEEAGGRQRGSRWGPRTIDVDIVEMESMRVMDDDLVIPHPEIGNREFWQRELQILRSAVGGGEAR